MGDGVVGSDAIARGFVVVEGVVLGSVVAAGIAWRAVSCGQPASCSSCGMRVRRSDPAQRRALCTRRA